MTYSRNARRAVLPLILTSLVVLVGSLLGPRQAFAASSATDNFARANGGLGANWTATSDGGLSIASDQAVGASSGNSGDMWSAEAFTSDQYSQVMLTSTQLTATQWVGPSVRAQSSGQDAYVAIYFWNNGSPEIMLFLRNGGWEQLGSSYSVSPLAAGAVLSLQAAGSALTVAVNGTTVITATSTTYTGGAPGLMTNGAAHAAAWAGGSGPAPAGSSAFGSGSGSGSSPTYTIGGTVSGLSGTVVLQDNGTDTLSVSASGSFTFATALVSGAAYSVTVSSSPSGQACTAANASGTVASANITTVTISCVASTPGPSSATDNFARANGGLGANWTATSDGGLSIASDQAVGASSGNSGDMWSAEAFTSDQYSQVMLTSTQLTATQWVGPSVRAQSSGQDAYVAIYFWNNGSPEIMLFLRNGGWEQLGSSYSVSPLAAGAVLSLQAAGSALTVAVNGTTVITATSTTYTGGAPGLMTNGAAHAAAWAGGSGPAPAGSSAFGSGSGSGSSPTYTIGGTVSGLSGTVVLQDNGTDTLSVSASGSFTFATALVSGAAYSVTVSSSPSGQACTAANASGTVASANITTVTISCQNIGPLTVSYVSTDANGVATYNMTSPIVNSGLTEPLRVLAPTNPAPGVVHNFLIALPVEPGEGTTYGDAISTLESLNAQNQYNLTIIEPSFDEDPWYADSATNPTELEETFMTDQLVPWIKANLATTGTEQVWLIGFSKSGVGAQDLILKHPSVYTLAASWDFPDSTSYDALGTSEATGYGTNANFVANYELSQTFVDTYAAPFTAHKRIWIGGYYYFDWDVYDTYAPELTTAGIQYDEEPATEMAHEWQSGWVAGALAALYQDSINLSS
jgi:Putative esterase